MIPAKLNASALVNLVTRGIMQAIRNPAPHTDYTTVPGYTAECYERAAKWLEAYSDRNVSYRDSERSALAAEVCRQMMQGARTAATQRTRRAL